MTIEAIKSLIVTPMGRDNSGRFFKDVKVAAGKSIKKDHYFPIKYAKSTSTPDYPISYSAEIIDSDTVELIEKRTTTLTFDRSFNLKTLEREEINLDPNVNTKIRWVEGE